MTDAAASSARRPILRFAVMCTDALQAWQVNVIQHLTAGQNAELVLLIKAPPRPQEGWAQRTIGRLLEPKLLWRLFYGSLSRKSHAMRLFETTTTCPRVRAVVCQVQKQGTSEYLSEGDVAAIERENLDFILHFASDAIRGAILKAARYGVWSFHHGDEQRYRGVPPGFWEIYYGDPVNGVILQRLTEHRGTGIILKKGYLKTIDYSYTRHIDHLYFDTAEWPAYVAAEIQNGVADYFDAGPSKSDAPIHRAPSNLALLRFFVAIARNLLGHVGRRFFQSEEWNIGVVCVPASYFLSSGSLPPIEWMQVQSKNWVADPMAVVVDGTIHILCEHFNTALGRGSITRTTFDCSGWGKLECAIAPAVHASYPYLIEDRNAIYCVPETASANEVALYLAAPFPTRWTKECALLTGFSAIDSTIFRHDGRWWLFCTRRDGDTSTTQPRSGYRHLLADNHLLYAYCADNLLGPWRPHLANPVKMDIRSSRPAGPPFLHDGELFRPSQDCSKTYGGRITINRIDALSPSEFREETCAMIVPDSSGPYPGGLHTISPAGEMCVIDGKRWLFKLTLFSEIRSCVSAALGFPR